MYMFVFLREYCLCMVIEKTKTFYNKKTNLHLTSKNKKQKNLKLKKFMK